MSAATASGVWTRAHLEDLPDDGRRYEIVDGRLLVSPAARRSHQRAVAVLGELLQRWARKHGGEVAVGPNVDIGPSDHLEPDVVWHRRPADGDQIGFHASPSLVVEVLSSSTREFDESDKLSAYVAGDAEQVWLVDLDAQTITRHVARDGAVVDVVEHDVDDVIATDDLPGLELPVRDVVAPELRAGPQRPER